MPTTTPVLKITRLVIDLGGEDKEITIGQARQLQAALNEIFGEPEPKVVKEREYVPSPYPVPMPYPQPYRVYPRPWHWDGPYITWTTGVSNTTKPFDLAGGATLTCSRNIARLSITGNSQ